MERVQVGSLGRPEGLRPAARPVDTTVTPVGPEQTNPALMLAETLSSINPQLQSGLRQMQERQVERQTALAERRLAGMTVEEANAAVADGSIHEYSNPWFRAAFDRLLGGRSAREAYADIQQRMASGDIDPVNADLDSLIAELNNSSLEGQGVHFQNGWLDVMEASREDLIAAQGEYRATETRERRLNAFVDTLFDVGQDDYRNVRQAALDLVNSPAGAGVSLSEMDGMIMMVAERINTPEAIRHLLFTERTGEDGTTIPPIANKMQFADAATRMLESAERDQRSRTREAFGTTLTQLYLRAHDGDVSVIPELLQAQQRDLIEPATAASLIGTARSRDEDRRRGLALNERMDLRIMADQGQLTRQILTDARAAGVLTDDEVLSLMDRNNRTRSDALTRAETQAIQADLRTAVLDSMTPFFEANQLYQVNALSDEDRTMTFTRADGSTDTVTLEADEIIEHYSRGFIDRINTNESLSQADKVARIQAFVQENRVTNPYWETLFDNMATVSLAELESGTPEDFPEVMNALNLASMLDAPTLRMHVDLSSEDGTFLATSLTAMRTLGMEPWEAARHVAAAMSNPDFANRTEQMRSQLTRDYYRELGTFGNLTSAQDTWNGTLITDIQTDLVPVWAAALNVSPPRALEAVNEMLDETFIVNRRRIHPRWAGLNTGQQREVMNGFVQDWFRQYGEASGIGSEGDLNLSYNPNTNRYTIMEGPVGLIPRVAEDGSTVPVSWTQQEIMDAVRDQQGNDQARRETNDTRSALRDRHVRERFAEARRNAQGYPMDRETIRNLRAEARREARELYPDVTD